MQNKKMMLVWVLIVIVVIAVLVFITIKHKNVPAQTAQPGTEQNTNTNMDNTQGVKISITKEGTGAAVKTGDMIAVNYTGKLADGTVFDSNVDPKFNHVQPFIFTVGEGKVIKGWDVGVVGMKVGEQRTLEIQPDFGYGAAGTGPIPPNAVLTFTVELLAIKQ